MTAGHQTIKRIYWLTGALVAAFIVFAARTHFFDPLAVDLSAQLLPPSAEHWFGTDQYGRDVFSRVVAGAPLSFGVSASATIMALLIGATFGGLAGYRGGWIDTLISAVVDSLTALPALLLALLIMAVLGPSAGGVAAAVGLASAPSVARVMRSAVFSIREKDYVCAARLFGTNEVVLFLRHVAPNCITPIAVLSATLAAQALLIESALSFLGLGAPPPAATWGGLLADSRQFITTAPWLGIFPGVTLSFCVIAINFIGDALRERFDPGLRS
jgi:peptide/nickel transport system permease protein